jgi:hypothetical protein
VFFVKSGLYFSSGGWGSYYCSFGGEGTTIGVSECVIP